MGTPDYLTEAQWDAHIVANLGAVSMGTAVPFQSAGTVAMEYVAQAVEPPPPADLSTEDVQAIEERAYQNELTRLRNRQLTEAAEARGRERARHVAEHETALTQHHSNVMDELADGAGYVEGD